MLELNFFSDPAHGWLEVPMSLIDTLGISGKISAYSYKKGGMAYLEEDCDAPMFSRAAKERGLDYRIWDTYQENTPIRNYSRFTNNLI